MIHSFIDLLQCDRQFSSTENLGSNLDILLFEKISIIAIDAIYFLRIKKIIPNT